VTGARAVQLAVLGPAAAALVWLVLAPWRWPRRLIAGAVALGSHGAAWWVFWLAYLGDRPAWRGLSPSLLGATLVAAAEVGVLFAVVEAERRRALSPVLLAGLGASATAVVLAGYTGSLILLAAAIPVPTLAVAATALAGPMGRWGLVELAAADVVALLGVSVAFDRTDTSVIAVSTGLGVGLILAAAAIKAGAVPGLGTARLLAAAGGPRPLGAVLRAQGILLAGVAGLVMARGQEMAPAAIAATVTVGLAGVVALLARRPSTTGAALIAAGAGVPFLALGLGGGFGARAFLVTFPAFLLAAGVVQVSVPADRLASEPSRRVTAAAGILAAGLALGSLVGLPPGGGFPGTWMTLSLAIDRGLAMPWFLLVAGGTLLGLALAVAGGIRLLRAASLKGAMAALSVLAGAALVYVGSQPVRLGVGWWLRSEESLGLPVVLPSAGGPTLPAVGGINLLLALAPAVVLILAAVALGRGARLGMLVPSPAPPGPEAGPSPTAVTATTGGVMSRLRRALSKPLTPARRFLGRPAVGLGLGLVVEAAAVVLVVRLLVLGSRGGFL
jgi:hypothetical protein